MPRAASTATTGSVPPSRTGAGRQPVPRAMPSRGGDQHRVLRIEGRGQRHAVVLDGQLRARPARRRAGGRRGRPPSAAASCPGARRSDSVAVASPGMLVFTAPGSPAASPCTSSDGEARVRW